MPAHRPHSTAHKHPPPHLHLCHNRLQCSLDALPLLRTVLARLVGAAKGGQGASSSVCECGCQPCVLPAGVCAGCPAGTPQARLQRRERRGGCPALPYNIYILISPPVKETPHEVCIPLLRRQHHPLRNGPPLAAWQEGAREGSAWCRAARARAPRQGPSSRQGLRAPARLAALLQPSAGCPPDCQPATQGQAQAGALRTGRRARWRRGRLASWPVG